MARFAFRACVSILCSSPVVRVMGSEPAQEIGRDKPQFPQLTRCKVAGENFYGFDFEVEGRPELPVFEKFPVGLRAAPSPIVYHLFPVNRPANTPAAPLRWDVVDAVLYCTRDVTPISPSPGGVVLLRFPLVALIPNNDGLWPLDRSKVPSKLSQAEGLPAPNYASCEPISQALQGFHRGWKEGKNVVGTPAKVVHYDIRALDDTQVELYMTSDGEFSKWVFDGKTWKNWRHYDLQVTGEFLVFDEGRALITERDGQWVVIANIENQEPTFLPVVPRTEDKPLILVEDILERSYNFLHVDRLLDNRGRQLLNINDARDRNERIRRVIDFVRERRRP